MTVGFTYELFFVGVRSYLPTIRSKPHTQPCGSASSRTGTRTLATDTWSICTEEELGVGLDEQTWVPPARQVCDTQGTLELCTAEALFWKYRSFILSGWWTAWKAPAVRGGSWKMRSPCAMFLVATRCRPLVFDKRRANGAQLDLCSDQSALWWSLV